MRCRRLLFLSVLLPTFSFALEEQPWFCDCLEFHLLASYAYSRFNSVEGAIPQIKPPFNSNVGYLGLEFCPSPQWDIDTDFQVSDTSAANFNFRSMALQMRYLWFDDIVGDPVSFSTGGSVRFTNSTSLRDVSCPSRANVDFEANFSLGKEFDASLSWRWRLWCFGAVGHGNRGSPWVRAVVSAESNINDRHRFAVYALGSNGYGRHTHLNPYDFYGYARYRPKSIDVGVRYGCCIGVWGALRFDYMRRVLAKVCPQNVNTFVVSYLLPFSF